ncbi:hypothetical protein H0H92_015237 [Tricholoma furcatifolium]|nr:hypothetical protein H0H92_015237 [Tricholoma furcatifolium]
MDSAIHALNLSDRDGYVTKVPGQQTTAKPTNVDYGDDQGTLLVSHNVLACTQTTQVDQTLQDAKSLSPALESEIIVELQQHVKESGVLPAHYVINDMESSGIIETRGSFADISRGYYQGSVVCVKENRIL